MKFALPALLILAAQSLNAQVKSADLKTAEPRSDPQTYQTLYLSGAMPEYDASAITTDLRNMLPMAKLYYIPSQNAISMLGSADDFALARKILADLNKTPRTYRLTYTITESSGGQIVGTRNLDLVVIAGKNASLTQENRVPVVTGTAQSGTNGQNTVDYQNVGLKIDAFLDGTSDVLRLRTLVQQSSVIDEKSSIGTQDPVIRQNILDTTSTLAQNKRLILGTLDIPGTGRREEIEVSSELIQ